MVHILHLKCRCIHYCHHLHMMNDGRTIWPKHEFTLAGICVWVIYFCNSVLCTKQVPKSKSRVFSSTCQVRALGFYHNCSPHRLLLYFLLRFLSPLPSPPGTCQKWCQKICRLVEVHATSKFTPKWMQENMWYFSSSWYVKFDITWTK